MQFVFVGEQAIQADRPTGMELAVADSQLSAQAVAKTIGKARGGVVEDPGRVNLIHEQRRNFRIAGENAFRVARAVMVDVVNGFSEEHTSELQSHSFISYAV